LDTLVSRVDIENDEDVKDNLTYLYQLNPIKLKNKLLETLNVLEKLKKFKLLKNILETKPLNYVDGAILLFKSYYQLGYLENVRSHLTLLINYIIKNKLWNKSSLLQSVIDEKLFKNEVIGLRIQTLYGTGQYEDLIELISNLQNRKDALKSKVLSNVLKADIPELVSYKISLLLKDENIKLDEKLKKIILFYNDERIIKSLERKNRSTIEYRIIKSENCEDLKTDIFLHENNKVNEIEPVQSPSYRSCHEEEKFLIRLKLKDPMFEEYNRDIAISFINLGMYKLVVEYLSQFDLDNDGVYLKLECLNFMGKYSQVIDIINFENLDSNLAFRYLKAVAYSKMGVNKLAKKEFLKVAREDSNFRDIKELIK
jgi:hypothetical protein